MITLETWTAISRQSNLKST